MIQALVRLRLLLILIVAAQSVSQEILSVGEAGLGEFMGKMELT